MSRVPPHDPLAEDSVLGAMMIDPSVVPAVRQVLSTGDFYSAANQAIFDAIVACWLLGDSFDLVVVADQLRQAGRLEAAGGVAALAKIAASTPASSVAYRYAEVVSRLAHLRRVLHVATEAAEAAWDAGSDPEEVVEQLRSGVLASAVTGSGIPEDANSLDEWLQEEHAARPWVVPALFREGWRVIVVAEEGSGKSVASRQIAICAAQGIHPFTFTRFDPVNTLLIDLENPDEAIEETARRITNQARHTAGEAYREHGCWIWHRPAGMDLRRRADRSQFDALLAHVRPKLVCLGPLYRSFTRRGREDHEEVAEQVQGVLDDLRTRHGFALMLEHHAPKASGGGSRNLIPFGSSLWQRWPDMGVTFRKDPDVRGALKIGRYRGDRVQATWPDRIDRGHGGWPWVGFYENGWLEAHSEAQS